jgi:hypothetical protein
MYAFAALVIKGYEYHDDYVETSSFSVTITDSDVWTYADAENFILDEWLHSENPDDYGPFVPWLRIASIEHVQLN